jgi:CRISPR/Cas system CSM-associated protein Csm3 (group 7 of RAMP superfamily)
MKFQKRWLIEGTLTTRTPLRIGDGGTTKRQRLMNKQTTDGQAGRHVEIASVAVDASRRTHLPASTVKSCVKAWARGRGMPLRTVEILFGSDDPDERRLPTGEVFQPVAGKVEFDNSPAEGRREFTHDPPYWCEERWTGVEAAVTLGRRTRAARDERLFHQEYVPPGVAYRVTLRVEDTDADEGVSGERGVAQLLAAMEGFNAGPDCVTLGSAGEDGRGRLEWRLSSIKYIDRDGIAEWLKQTAPTHWRTALKEVDPAEFGRIESEAKRESEALARNGRAGGVPTLALRLECRDDFLVNDPTRTNGPGGAGSSAPNHAPLCDIDGNPILPRRSARGAFRAQAEKILRTLGGDAAACHADDPQSPCQRRAISSIKEVINLCPACRVFGAPGWRSPFRASAFVAEAAGDGDEATRTRDFIAVDRFKQSVAVGNKEEVSADGENRREGSAGMKFDAKVVRRPILNGDVGLDLGALERVGVGLWAIGLLALTVRDLAEGDVRVGFGRSKGFGDISARVTAISALDIGNVPASFRGELTEADLRNIDPSAARGDLSATSFGRLLSAAVEDLHRELGVTPAR